MQYDKIYKVIFYYCVIFSYDVEKGPVAQGLEQSAHNRLVVGSNPPGPTKVLLSEGLRHFSIKPRTNR